MVEAVVVTKALSQDMISAGAELTKKLAEKLSIRAAFWFLVAETETWRFIVSTPETDTQGPKKVYSTIQKVLSKQRGLPAFLLSDISVVSPQHPLVQVLKSAIGTAPGVSGVRFSRNTVNGQFIEDAYIYRVHLPNAA